MAANDNEARAWEMMKSISICMLTTREGDILRSRPMGAYVRPQENAIYFLADARHHADEQIRHFPHVSLAFADASNQKYIAVNGRAQVSRDPQKVKELWGTPAKAWWDSPDDPNIRVLTVTPEDAEYWDSPGTVVSYAKMAIAAVTGSRPTMGDNRKVAM